MTSNPVEISIPANSVGTITCMANAESFQRVTLEWLNNTLSFQGIGKGEPMKTPAGDASSLLYASSRGYQIAATFEYSPSDTYQKSMILEPVITVQDDYTVIQVTSEDSNDNNNNSYLTIAVVSGNPTHRSQAKIEDQTATSMASMASGNLELHAKTYYDDNPYMNGGDEHYITIPPFTGKLGDVEYRSTGWQHMIEGTCWDDQSSPAGGYLRISVKVNSCIYAGMHDAVLTLTTVIPYWFSKPTGLLTPKWVGIMVGSQYHLTRVGY